MLVSLGVDPGYLTSSRARLLLRGSVSLALARLLIISRLRPSGGLPFNFTTLLRMP